MTRDFDTKTAGAGARFDLPLLASVDRAADEMRRGIPVVMSGADGTGAIVALAAELATDDTLAAMRVWARQHDAKAEPDVVLTHNRAETLKIRLYTPDVVLVPLEAPLDSEMVRSLADPTEDLGHPLRGPFEGRRSGTVPAHAAAIRVAKIAHLLPAVVTVNLKTDDAAAWAVAQGLISTRVDDVLAYDQESAARLKPVTWARVPLDEAENVRLVAFRPDHGGEEHLAIIIGNPATPGPVLVRVHSECFTGDLIGSLKCDCGDQLRGAIREIAESGQGILLYLAQEGRGIGLMNKMRAYQLQDQGFDTNEANERLGFDVDERVFLPAAAMLEALGYRKVRLMTNNPAKVEGLRRLGIDVVDRVEHRFPANEHNRFYLSTKKEKSGHLL